MAAAVLVDPIPHIGKSYVLTETDRLSFDEIASMFSKLLKRKIAYIDDLRAEIRKPSRSVICCANQSPHVNAPIDRYFQCLACRFAGSSGDQDPTLHHVTSTPQAL
ncbi:MAG: hypothetical protein ACOY91_10775 [Pseudomonadota bacterium]